MWYIPVRHHLADDIAEALGADVAIFSRKVLIVVARKAVAKKVHNEYIARLEQLGSTLDGLLHLRCGQDIIQTSVEADAVERGAYSRRACVAGWQLRPTCMASVSVRKGE